MYKPQSRFQIFMSKLTGEKVSKTVTGPKTKEESYLQDMSITIRPKEFYFYEVDNVLRPIKSLAPRDFAGGDVIMDAYLTRGIVFRKAGAVMQQFVAGMNAYVPICYEFTVRNDGSTVVSTVYIMVEDGTIKEIVPFDK